MAALLVETGRYGEAEARLWWALTILEDSVGEEHPRSLMVRQNLSRLLKTMGRSIDDGPVLPGPMPSAIWFEFRDGVLHRADKPAPATLESLP